MPGPAQSLCPRCEKRPRRRAGLPCQPCSADEQRKRRAEPATYRKHQRVSSVDAEPPARYARPLNATRYLVTWAQNATPVHEGFLASLQTAAKHLRAELVVVPGRYKNPTSIWSREQETEERWAPELEPYMFNVRRKLGHNLVLAADVKVQPTAGSPLTGFEALTGAESCIIAHPKMQLRSVAAPSSRYPKILSTTGACTRRNYTDSKAGKLGHFHHFLGAVVVELSGSQFRLWQVNADRVDGSFTHLDRHYTAKGHSAAPPALGLALGDTHVRTTDPGVDAATFGPGGIVEALRPRKLVWHDLFDGYSVNPHHAGNPFIAAAKLSAGWGNVREEVQAAVRFVAERTRPGIQSVIVPSNHDNFLSRWVIATDWRGNPGNAAFYLETARAMLASTRMGPGGAEYADPFTHWVGKLRGKAAIRCLARDESFKLGDIECGLHGDKGPNGARGSMKNLSRIGAKVISGHGHTPGIEEGHYRVGTSTPRALEYTGGPSSWLNAHVVTYATGARALLVIVDGKWRLR